MLDIPKTLVTARKSVGLTQETVAELSGVNKNQISLYELGKVSPSVPVLISILEVYGLELTVTTKAS